jgi:hypothetical protein
MAGQNKETNSSRCNATKTGRETLRIIGPSSENSPKTSTECTANFVFIYSHVGNRNAVR